MPLPKKIKKYLPLVEPKVGLPRREELLEKINKDGTYLPKSLLHADLDGGFLDFVKEDLELVVDGKKVPNIDILITTQNWAQFTQTWDFQNIDKNAEPPFIAVIRVPEVKYGTNPATVYTIPNRRLFFYAQVPTWDGNRQGMDIYKIPQPVPVDITYQVKIVCNRMRELNQFNKQIIEKFSSRQAYRVIKGHYIPIVMGGISDESVMDVEKRKYYIQSYEFTMLGFLIDENEFEVMPAISRTLQVVEVDTRTTSRRRKRDFESKEVNSTITFAIGVNSISEKFDYVNDLSIVDTTNMSNYDVYINNDYYGSSISTIQINNGDVLRIQVDKIDVNNIATIELSGLLV
jgi:hypothetical protein